MGAHSRVRDRSVGPRRRASGVAAGGRAGPPAESPSRGPLGDQCRGRPPRRLRAGCRRRFEPGGPAVIVVGVSGDIRGASIGSLAAGGLTGLHRGLPHRSPRADEAKRLGARRGSGRPHPPRDGVGLDRRRRSSSRAISGASWHDDHCEAAHRSERRRRPAAPIIGGRSVGGAGFRLAGRRNWGLAAVGLWGWRRRHPPLRRGCSNSSTRRRGRAPAFPLTGGTQAV